MSSSSVSDFLPTASLLWLVGQVLAGIVIIALVSLFLYAIVYQLWLRPLYDPIFKHPRVPLSKPLHFLFGHLGECLAEEPGIPQLRWANEYGGDSGFVLYRLMFNRPRVLCTDPAIAAKVMTSRSFEKPVFIRETLNKVVGNGLLTSEGEDHKWQRKMIAPIFSVQAVKNMGPYIAERARALGRSIDGKIAEAGGDGVVLDVHEVLTRFTLDVIGLTAFDHKFSSIESDTGESFRLYSDILGGMKFTVLGVLQRFFPPARIIRVPADVAAERARAKIFAMIDGIVASRRAEAGKGGGDKPKDLLGLMLHARDEDGGGLSDAEIREQVLTFLIAGHETTSVAITWTLGLLCLNPDAAAELAREIDTSTEGDGIGDPDILARLPYLDAVVKESMRLYPPAPILMRCATEDVTLAGTPIPNGTVVMLLPFVFHRKEGAWQGASEFNPGRWIDGSAPEKAYMPFWGGHRSCIGSRLAIAEMKTALAYLIKRYSFSREGMEPVRSTLSVTMRPKGGMPMKVSRRVPGKKTN